MQDAPATCYPIPTSAAQITRRHVPEPPHPDIVLLWSAAPATGAAALPPDQTSRTRPVAVLRPFSPHTPPGTPPPGIPLYIALPPTSSEFLLITTYIAKHFIFNMNLCFYLLFDFSPETFSILFST
jgi:hypothetical protein